MLNPIRIISTYFRLGVLSELEYRANFFIQVFESLLGLGVSISIVSAVVLHSGAGCQRI